MNPNGIVVFSGGSAANNLVDVFGEVANGKKATLSYVIPISDNGGSSSELIRVFGGPGIGDIRSRLVRLIPNSPHPSKQAIKALFSHRLSASPSLAKHEWTAIIEGHSPLWTHIPPPQRELLRSFLTTLHLEILKRSRPGSTFNFTNAAVGNLWLTGARLFMGSFEAAIEAFRCFVGVSEGVRVLPVVNSVFSHHICAVLADGGVVVGQNEISHPENGLAGEVASIVLGNGHAEADASATSSSQQDLSPTTPTRRQIHLSEDSNLPGALPSLSRSSLTISKSHTPPLSSRISRIHYISNYGQEIRPAPNPQVLEALESAETVIYSIGSLFTSIIPCLILQGVGAGIAGVKYKILVLNGCLDREVSGGKEFEAWDFVRCIVEACVSSSEDGSMSSTTLPSTTSTATASQDRIHVGSIPEEKWHNYVTHVIHLEGEGVPKVDRARFRRIGIECVRLYGRKADAGSEGMVYDGKALEQALSAIVGRGGDRGGVGRRNTLIH